MRNALLFFAAATSAFFITVEAPVNPQAEINADFEPATQTAIRLASEPAPRRAVEERCLPS
jgi:hypothetical protein